MCLFIYDVRRHDNLVYDLYVFLRSSPVEVQPGIAITGAVVESRPEIRGASAVSVSVRMARG